MNEFKTICYDEITGDKAFKKGTVYTAKEYQKTIAITGEKDKKYALELHFLKHTFLSHFIDLRNPTIKDTIKYAITSGILQIVGNEDNTSSYGCEGIRCRYNDLNTGQFTNEFYFIGHDILDDEEELISSSKYVACVGIDKVSEYIVQTLEDMSTDEYTYMEAGIYLEGIAENIRNTIECDELAATLNELINKTYEMGNRDEPEV